MTHRVLVLAGTRRGLFILESDQNRAQWRLRGPLGHAGWSYGYIGYDAASGAIYAAGRNNWFGAAVWRSGDEGATWTLSSEGLAFGDHEPQVKQVWSVEPAHGALYAGVDPAGLFRSEDQGATWQEVIGLRSHPDYHTWRGGSGGLCLHSIVRHPTDPQQLWVGIAGGGVMYTADGGWTWAPRNATVRSEAGEEPGLRVQRLRMAPDGTLYQQNHRGVFRSADGGLTWREITANLPSGFGFPLALHPTDSQVAYVMPHQHNTGKRHMPDGLIAVWRTRDGGQSWQKLNRGLPERPAFVKVLREGMASDSLAPAGLYFGTSSGNLFGSADGGDSWLVLAEHLPEIYAVTAVVLPQERSE